MSLNNNVYDITRKIKTEPPPTFEFEHGHFRMPNDMQDALCKLGVSGATFQVLHCILRHTLGWNQLSDTLTNSRIKNCTALGDRVIFSALEELVARQVISISKAGHSKVIHLNTHVAGWSGVQDRIKRAGKPARKDGHESDQMCRDIGVNTPKNRIKRADIKNNRQKTDLPTVPLSFGEAAERIFVHWQQVMQKPSAKLTAERVKKIRARLQDGYSEESIIRAIDGCARSDFHMGRKADSPQQYNDIDLICRSGSKLEWFAAVPNRAENQSNWTDNMVAEAEVLF